MHRSQVKASRKDQPTLHRKVGETAETQRISQLGILNSVDRLDSPDAIMANLQSDRTCVRMAQMPKIKVTRPLVEMDGDEMTRIVWKMIKDRFIFPYLDIDTRYFDLSLPHRDETDDQVTIKAAEALKEHGVGVKCPTISVDQGRLKEFGLKQMWFSPNGTIRNMVGGTLFREPIIIPRIPRLVPAWKEPIIVARHAFGEIYHCKDAFFEGEGSLEMVYTPKNGESTRIKVFDFPSTGGVALTQYNTVDSVTAFARACFGMGLERKMPVYFATKYTIITNYDGMFKNIFQGVYDAEYRKEFESSGLFYDHRIIDDLVAQLLKISGPCLLAMKNYDGDVHSDQIAAGFGSVGLMMSSLVSPDGSVYMSEAAHGTVTKHFRKYLAGQETSTNPIACIFAWTRGLARIGQLDNAADLTSWAEQLEKAVVDTVNVEGVVTKDLAHACGKTERKDHVTTEEFMDALERRFRTSFHVNPNAIALPN